MRRNDGWRRTPLVLTAGCIFSLGLAGVGFTIGAQAERGFKPPRLAVVDISLVFEASEKKKDRQDLFQADIRAVEDKLKEFEKRHKELSAELPNLEPGEKRDEKELEKLKLEMIVRNLKQQEMKRLQDTRLKYLQEIREEITAEIHTYASAQNLNVVIEKTVVGETEGAGGFRWPIVHYADPEIDITKDIAERLNARYRPAALRNAPPDPTSSGKKPGGKP